MSEFVTIDLGIDDSDMEIQSKACKELGYDLEFPVAPATTLPLFGYHGDQREQEGIAVIRRKKMGHASNDSGFFKDPKTGKINFYLSKFDMDYRSVDEQGRLINTNGSITKETDLMNVNLRKLWFERPKIVNRLVAEKKAVTTLRVETELKKELKKLGFSSFKKVSENKYIAVGY